MIPLSELKILQKIVLDNFYHLESMKKHTSFNIGGPADCLVTPENFEQLKEILLFCRNKNYPVVVIGNGTNLLVSDQGVPGVVVKLAANYSSFHFDDSILVAKSGSSLSKLSLAAAQKGLTGLEFAIGIPGTVGGAVNMNAGAFGGEMKDIVQVVRALSDENEDLSLDKSNLRFTYRSSNIKGKMIVYEVELALKKDDPSEIKSRMRQYQQWRKERQPIKARSAGSVFKKPPNDFAGQLIELAGLKGMSFGGAQISPKHANFIVNKGNASASDVLYLIRHTRKVVFEKFGILLESEIDFLGFSADDIH
ncbi:UDP-N-acetylmuramate dehydrogenase [bacterium]|nr:UDP-N-acetylmuramate dehydrogenase [bacterium]